MEILPSINKLRAATYGRGFWETDLNTSVFNTVDAGAVSFSGLPQLVCDQNLTPSFILENYGSAMLTSATLNLLVDGNNVQSLPWTGNLASLSNAFVSFSPVTLTDGIHTLTVIVSNPNGIADPNTVNDTIVSTLSVTSSAITPPITEGFENIFPPVAFRISDPESMLSVTNAAGGFGTSASSLKAAFYEHTSGSAEMTSYPIDMTAFNISSQLTFDVAYKRLVPSTINDSLKVLVSIDCGATWTTLYSLFINRFGI